MEVSFLLLGQERQRGEPLGEARGRVRGERSHAEQPGFEEAALPIGERVTGRKVEAVEVGEGALDPREHAFEPLSEGPERRG